MKEIVIVCGIPSINEVHTTRDIIWLKQMFYNKELGQKIIVIPEILQDIEAKAGATDLPICEGGVPTEGTQDDATVAPMLLNPFKTWIKRLLCRDPDAWYTDHSNSLKKWELWQPKVSYKHNSTR
jgi:hypothetical protein